MKPSLRGRYFASISFLFLSLVFAASAQDKEWTWKDSSRQTRTQAELYEILDQNRIWVESGGQSGMRADLSGANLALANLTGANLALANLTGADLALANLTRADLTGADLTVADLTVANLTGADLTRANLTRADLTGATYEPKENPPPEYIARAKNLGWVRYSSDSKPLTDLRRSLKETGYRAAERQVTAALRRHDATLLETVFFDWTCEFGANAVRPLWICFLVWLVCAPIYWLFLHRGKRSGLYLLASGKEVNTGNDRMRVRRLRYRPPRRCRWYRYIFRVAAREWHALSTASLFSLMTAFNIGFRELNFGRWIRMLQTREFDIKARGMARVVSGIQSLLSVGLLALSLLSYFARPFEI